MLSPFCRWQPLGILHVSDEPIVHFPEHAQNRFPRQIAVRFQRQQFKAHCTALALDRAEQALALDWKRTSVVDCLAVDEEDGRLDLVRIRKRGHLVVHVWSPPVGSILI